MLGWFLRLAWYERVLVIPTAAISLIVVWTAASSFLLVHWMLGPAPRAYYAIGMAETYWQWWEYLFDPSQPRSINKWLIAAAVAPCMPFVAMFARYLVDRRGHHLSRRASGKLRNLDIGVTDNHGHAAFADSVDLHHRFAGPGCLIGAENRSVQAFQLYDDPNKGPGHSLVFAGPGSDKTSSIVNRVWNWRGPRVVFDPSGEIGPIMTEALKQRGFNVISIGPGEGGLNVLDWIDLKHPEADAFIATAVEWIYNDGATARGNDARDPMWPIWGRSLVKTLLAHLLYSGEQDRTLAKFMDGMNFPEDEMPKLLRGIYDSSTSKMARGGASGLMHMRADETFSGIYANARGATEWLNIGAYAKMTSGSVMRTTDILHSNTVVFVQIPLRTLQATPTLGRAVMGALFNAMYLAEGSVGDRILFELDEAWSLGAMKEVELCYATARKYRGTVQMIFPSEADMETVWTKTGAQAMRDKCSWRSYNAIQDGDTAERLSKDLGSHAVLAYSEGINSGSQKPWGMALPSSSRGTNANTHEIKRDLISRDEILRSPADQMFVLARDFPNPIRCCTAPYYRYPDIADRMNASRFVKATAE